MGLVKSHYQKDSGFMCSKFGCLPTSSAEALACCAEIDLFKKLQTPLSANAIFPAPSFGKSEHALDSPPVLSASKTPSVNGAKCVLQ
jgi:hypothetical protein